MTPLHPDDLPDALLRLDDQGRVSLANRRARELLGGDPTGRELMELVRDLAPDVGHQTVGFWRRMDGGVVELESSLDPESRVLLLRDMSDRATGLAELRNERQLLRTVLGAVPQSVWLLGPDHRVLRANRAAVKAMGWSEAELRADPSLLFRSVDAADRVWLRESVDRVVQHGETVVGDLRLPEATGPRVFEVVLEPIGVEAKRGRGVMMVARPITRERELIGIYREAARREVEQVGLLTTSLAQDLGNALTVIASAVDALEGPDDSVQRAQAALSQTHATLRDLLRLGRHADPSPAPIALGTLLERVVARLTEESGEHVRINLANQLGEALVLADSGTLIRILQPLGANALQAAGRAGQVSVHAYVEGDELLLEIEDDGAPLPPESLDELFKPFPDSGRGNQLALVKARVSRLGGDITAHTGEGGTSFRIRLPRYQDPGRVAQPTVEAPLPRTILLVEDDPQVRESLAWLLKSQKAQVLVAKDVREASALAARTPDLKLALLDLGLPDPGGEAALAAILQEHPELPVLVISGFASDEQVRRCLAKGAAGFLPKPFQLRELRRELARIKATRR